MNLYSSEYLCFTQTTDPHPPTQTETPTHAQRDKHTHTNAQSQCIMNSLVPLTVVNANLSPGFRFSNTHLQSACLLVGYPLYKLTSKFTQGP